MKIKSFDIMFFVVALFIATYKKVKKIVLCHSFEELIKPTQFYLALHAV